MNVGFDLDGTLFEGSHRYKYLYEGNISKFNEESLNDVPRLEVFNAFFALHNKGLAYVITSRPEEIRELTKELFRRNGVELEDDRLIMNSSGNHDLQYKVQTLSDMKDKILLYVENDAKIVEAVNAIGVPTINAGIDLRHISKEYYKQQKEGFHGK